MYLVCTLLFIFLASPTLSLPASPSHSRAADLRVDGGPLLGLMAETLLEPSDVTAHANLTAEQKTAIFKANMNKPSLPTVLVMALQLQADASNDSENVRQLCKEIVRLLAPSANDAACPWNYTCHYNQNRYPSFDITVQCLNTGTSCLPCNSRLARGSAKEKRGLEIVTPGNCQALPSESRVFLERNATTGAWPTIAIKEGRATSCQCTCRN